MGEGECLCRALQRCCELAAWGCLLEGGSCSARDDILSFQVLSQLGAEVVQDVSHGELGTPVRRISTNSWSGLAPVVTTSAEKRAQWSARPCKHVVKCYLISKVRTMQAIIFGF